LRNKFFAEDVRYHVSGRSPLSGVYDGVDQVLGLFIHLFELSGGTLSLELHDVLANDEHAVLLYAISAERDGKQLHRNEVTIAHIGPDGRVTEAWLQSSDQHAVDQFWS